MQSDLSNVLVLCAPYDGVSSLPMLTLAQFQAAGASVQLHQASADVSLTRCLQAASACEQLQANDKLEWVFWLDCDMVGEPMKVATMIDYSTQLRQLSEAIDPDYPSLSGCYLNRHRQPPQVAAMSLKRAEPIELNDGPLIPALTGMGCFLQHKSTFTKHCDESTHFHYKDKDTIIPEVCVSRLIHCSEYAQFIDIAADGDAWYWLGEDFDYCVRELEFGRLVYVAPAVFGHVDSIVLVPDGKCMFPGLKPTKAAHP